MDPIDKAIFELDRYFLIFKRDVKRAKQWFENEIEEIMGNIDHLVFENGSDAHNILLNAIDDNDNIEYLFALMDIRKKYSYEQIYEVMRKNYFEIRTDRFFKKEKVLFRRE